MPAVAELSTPQTTRLRRPGWRDPRLVAGIVLVLLATALGARIVASADDTISMYAAARTLQPGEQLTGDALRRVDVQLGDHSELYLPAAGGPPADAYAMREVREGELVPTSAVGTQAQVAVQQVTVLVDANSASGLAPGSVVDVWVSRREPQTTQERYLDATRMLRAVSVSPVAADSGRFGVSSSTTAVTLRVPKDKVSAVIGAVDAQSRFTLVPVPGSS